MSTTDDRVAEALAWLEQKGSKRVKEEARTRYGIDAPKSFGVPVGMIQQLAKKLGKDHALAPKSVPMPKTGAQPCLGCHRPSTSPGFSFAAYWAKIRH